MLVKTILVCLNAVERADQLIKLACDLAVRQEAHLIGLYVIPGVQYYSVPGDMHGAIDINKEQRNYYESHSEPVHNKFEAMVRKASIIGEWRCVQSENVQMANCAIDHCMRSDLVVVGQSPEEGFDGFEREFAERLIMESGRPVLIVPHTGTFSSIATHIIIGWNMSPEAARASADAIPLLQRAEQATIVTVNADANAAGEDLPGADLATMLSRHEVTVKTEAIMSTGRKTGEALLTKASDLGADLIVTGAYGHSRLREYIFGGVTRYLLKHMTVPVLMSH